ncbi:MAG TPA: plastocyanin/azurin family copper-binding protein [Longimicrobiaceae bacterium]|nr:plastocyanin/azurin family copper-binding protein [Longimicrobiaceae bacterium]
MKQKAVVADLRALAALAGLALVAGGCGGGGAAVTTPNATEQPVFAALRVDPPSASVPVGGTVQLSVVPVDGNGTPFSGLPAPTFTSGDEARATVSSNGLVTGKAAGNVTITASLSANGVTRTATAAVNVTAGSAPPANPGNPGTPGNPSPSSATVNVDDHTISPQTVTIAAGGTVTWKMLEDEHDITFDGAAPTGGNIPKTDEGKSVSRTFPTAGTYTYRCARHESKGKTGTVIVTGGTTPPPPPPPNPPTVPSSATVTTPGNTFSPAAVTIATGGTVQWQISGSTHNVTFQGTAPPGGNVPDTNSGNTVSRTFPTAGSYSYQCTRHNGMTGRVVVQ